MRSFPSLTADETIVFEGAGNYEGVHSDLRNPRDSLEGVGLWVLEARSSSQTPIGCLRENLGIRSKALLRWVLEVPPSSSVPVCCLSCSVRAWARKTGAESQTALFAGPGVVHFSGPAAGAEALVFKGSVKAHQISRASQQLFLATLCLPMWRTPHRRLPTRWCCQSDRSTWASRHGVPGHGKAAIVRWRRGMNNRHRNGRFGTVLD